MSSWFEDFDFTEAVGDWGLDTQSMYGIGGQLAGHGIVWAKKLATGTPVEQVFTPELMFWAAFSIVSETLSSTASDFAETKTAGIVAPAIVQYSTINMFNEKTRNDVTGLMRGDVGVLLDNASLAGIVGSVVAKSYVPQDK